MRRARCTASVFAHCSSERATSTAIPYLPLITPFLDDLRQDLDETFHLGRLDGTDIVYLATRESKQYNRVQSRVGRRLPAYATALGKSLLAERFGVERDTHVPPR